MLSPASTRLLSFGIVFGLIAALAAWFVACAWQRKLTVPQHAVLCFGYLMARILWRGQVVGAPLQVAENEGAVLICNHLSPFDPAFFLLTTDRLVHWMVAREYCENPVLAWFLRIPKVIPVGRAGIDTAATKLAIRYAQSGDLVGLLPEGRLNLTDQLLLPGRPGAALIALKARVPVIPCYISGSPFGRSIIGSLFLSAKAQLVVGQPMDISAYYGREKERGVLETLTKQFLREIAGLAGHDDYEPQLAGRKWKPGH